MNTTTPISEAKFKEIKEGLFRESLNEILERYPVVSFEFSEKIIKSAKLYNVKCLSGEQLIQLIYLATAWNQNITIDVSNSHIEINFTLKNN
jgi:hypothetical protein